MSVDNPDRLLERFAYIETELFWGGGLTARQLASTFGISRQVAQKNIDQYRQQHPGYMEYSKSWKRHEATESFTPTLIRPSPLSFLDYLRGECLVGYYRDEQEWSDMAVTDVDRLFRPDLPLFPVREVLVALRSHKTVNIDYRKKDLAPASISIRKISPNHLVYADSRYHIRAYCHEKQRYLDFVLSRIVHAEIISDDWVSAVWDKEWNEFTELQFKPNPSLPISAQHAILKGFDDKGCGFRSIKCRKALVYYLNRKLLATDAKYKMPLWCLVTE